MFVGEGGADGLLVAVGCGAVEVCVVRGEGGGDGVGYIAWFDVPET